jgi:hypothetical protein
MKRSLSLGVWLPLLALVMVASTLAQTQRPANTVASIEYMVEMRDGVKLATDIYLPEGDGPWPVVLARTPYNKGGSARGARRYVDNGYVYAVQDQRGRFRSEGDYIPHEHELHDGYDTVEWLGVQPWSNGRVGMTGGSALGIAGNLAAAADPPHLRAAYFSVAPRSLFYEGRFVGGLFKEEDTGGWMRGQGVSEDEVTAYRKRVVLDKRWQETDLIFHRHNIDIPIYNAGGWYDLFGYGTVMNFKYQQEWGREGAKGNQKVMVGPIGHGPLSGDLEYPESRLGSDEELRFFDYWLRGIDTGIADEPPVKYYMMASARKGHPSAKNGWRTADQWPPSASRRVRYYLTEAGALTTRRPTTMTASTTYTFDPSDPVPTLGGLNLRGQRGPMDQRDVGERTDYLRFQTPVLEEDLVVAGKIDLELWASSDARDTDFIAKLVDVYPDGYEALVLDMGLRARFRDGRRTEDVKLLTPGEPTRMSIDLWNTAITIERGHRLAVHLTSSNYPRFDVNPNTGEAVGETTLAPRIANNTIYHDAKHPTALLLPVMREASPTLALSTSQNDQP